jgi:hypothetical protein
MPYIISKNYRVLPISETSKCRSPYCNVRYKDASEAIKIANDKIDNAVKKLLEIKAENLTFQDTDVKRRKNTNRGSDQGEF